MIIFLIFIFILIFSIIGYGKLFQKFFFNKEIDISNGLLGFFGLFFLSSISYFTHLIYPHNYLHNSVLIFFGVAVFFLFIFNKQIEINKYSYLILLCLLIGIFIAKSHDDFPYYHLPNAIHFTQNKLEFGLGNLNHGFKHHSSIFYLYSVFYLPFIEIYLFNFLNFLFLFFTSIFLFDNINKDFENKKFNNITLINIIFLILSVSIFNRIGEYGTDITGQLVSLILICLSLDVILKKETKFYNLLIILTLLIYLITIKTYFVLYIIFPVTLIFFFNDYLSILKKFIISKLFIFLLVVALLFIIINVSATGCVIYPVSTLCFPNYFSWGIELSTIDYLSQWYEIWSKAGAGPDFREQNPSEYIKKFNWFANWIDRYFFTKVTDFLFSIFLCYLVVYFLFRKYLNFKFSLIKKENIILIGLFIISIIWFLKFPSLRYGGYAIFISIFTIIFVQFFHFSNLNYFELKKKFLILFSLSILIFISKNVLRINHELNYTAVENFKSFPFFYVKKVKFDEILINGEKIYKVDGMCWATNSPCLRNINKKIIFIKNYRVYLNNDK